MTWAVTADVNEFPEASAWFRSKFPVTERVAAELGAYAGPRAFTIAGVEQLEVVNAAFESLAKAIDAGTPFEDWKSQVEDQLTEAWGKRDSARLETVFRNATSQAYSAGRWRQMNDPAVMAFRPYGMFDGVADERQSEFCRAWDGTILPMERFAELNAVPQCHHRCRSQIRSMRESDAMARGVTVVPPAERTPEGFGAAPTESEWRPDPSRYPRELFAEYQIKRSELARQVDRPRLDQ